MISRYEKKEISKIWDEDQKFSYFLNAELAIMKAIESLGTKSPIPLGTSDKIRKDAKIDAARITEIEKTVKHDVIAFCTSITENLPAEVAKFFHFGVTSSDIIDTALMLQIKDSLVPILSSLKKVLRALDSKAQDLKSVMTMGRSHGMYAEPLSMGQKFLGHYAEFFRRYQDILAFFKNDLTIQFSGAVGNYTIITPELEDLAATQLGLLAEPVSTQVIPRDRIAKLIGITSQLATAIERIAVEIRHLHRSEVAEVSEGFAKGQKGSSIMPHKKNPIAAENLTGMARILKSHYQLALENCVLWHERDISHSSAERMYLPDHFGILLYALDRLDNTLNNLDINQERIEQRVFEDYSYLSSYYLHHLIQITKVKREDLYYWVQQAAFHSQKNKSAEAFHQKLLEICKEAGIELKLSPPTPEQIKKIYLKSVDQVYQRVKMTYGPISDL